MEANCLNMIFFGLLFCICGVHERDVRVSGEEAFWVSFFVCRSQVIGSFEKCFVIT